MRYIKTISLSLFVVIFGFSSISFAETLGGIKSTTFITGGTVNGPTLLANDFYAYVSNIGDLDNDGVTDIGVGAYGDDTGGNRAGVFYISYLNIDGTVKSTVKITTNTANGPTLLANDFYGKSLAGIGDLDNDGIPDIAVGAYGDDTGGATRGAVYIHYMNRDGSIKSTVKLTGSTTNGATLVDGDSYGWALSSLGDLDNDGIPDIAVGTVSDDTGGSGCGAVYIHYMNRDGSIKSTVKLSGLTTNGATLIAQDFYGYDVSNIGDLDNDGIQDLLVGAGGDETGGTDRGAAYIHYMNRDGSIKSTVKLSGVTTNGATLANSDFYGEATSSLGDLDNDGIPDIAVGAAFDDNGGTNNGAVYIHYMNRDGSIKSTVKLNGSTTNGAQFVPSSAGEQYGIKITSLGDLNNDGATDIAIGATLDTYTGGPGSNSQYGRVFIHFMQPVIGNRATKSSLAVSEAGTTDSLSISLKSKPSSDVAVSFSGSQVTTSPTSLTFTSSNWNTPQAVTVSAIDDNLVENTHSGTVTLTDTSADTDYNSLTSSIGVTITDNDRRTTQIIVPVIPKSLQGQGGTVLGFTINNNSSYTTNKTVTLNMNADTSTVRGYLVSTDPSFVGNTGIKPYVQTDQYTLPEKFGTYTIYLKYYSTTGHFSDVISKTMKYQPVVKVQKKVVKKMVKSTKR